MNSVSKKISLIYIEMFTQIFNFLIGCLGCLLLSSSIYIWLKVKSYKYFILILHLISYCCILITITGCSIKINRKSLLTYLYLNLILFTVLLALIIFLVVCNETIIENIIDNNYNKDYIRKNIKDNNNFLFYLCLIYVFIEVNIDLF